MIRILLLALALLASAGAQAHKASDAYLQLTAGEQGLVLRWDIALRDLDVAIGLDADDDGRLTWGEVRAAWPRIEAYAVPRLRIDGCPLRLAGHGLERRGDGAYATLRLESACALKTMPVLHYALLRDVDPTHRGIAKLQFADGRAPLLRLLEPTELPTAPPPGGFDFLLDGVRHIVTGYDHVLFLLCLLLPAALRRSEAADRSARWEPVGRPLEAAWPVVGIVSAFTVAHSITLGLAAMKWVVLPAALIEPAIAVTIVLAALDNIRPIFPVRRVVVTFCFGLIHGFGFAGVLAELSLPRAKFAFALLEFNVGLELGQLAIVTLATALLFGLRHRPGYRALVVRGGSLAAMAIAALWLIERTANVSLLPV
ncbi:MAG TPA: HupE/UreJ family protein [Burkholderiaceae bacterium]|nr:HupE/UreJ family protein [Burkholderiaceae bacterium]